MTALALSFTHPCCIWLWQPLMGRGPAGRLMRTEGCWLPCKRGQDSCVSPAYRQKCPLLSSGLGFTSVWHSQANSYLPPDLRKGSGWPFVANCGGDLACSWAVGWRMLRFQGSGGQFAHRSHETSNDSSASLLTCAPGLRLPSALGISNPTKLATSILQNYHI